MTPRSPMQRSSTGVLVLLACLFLAAGMSRLGMGVAEVIAAETGNPEEDSLPAVPLAEADPGDLIAALRLRAEALDARAAELDARGAMLRQAETDLQAQLDQLAQAEARLAATLRVTETAAEDDLRHLTTVFEAMKPAQAASLFAQMDAEFAAGFIGRLRPDFAGEVMSGLDPMIAYAISAILAGRHARTPRD